MGDQEFSVAVIGGGAAGYFSAIQIAEQNPRAIITIFEKGKQVLTKVKISGGGRCNVTHDCYDPKELIGNYPRGSKELLGPFHSWQPADMLSWLEEKGVETKAEDDGRIFPISDSSQTIIDCFQNTARNLSIQVKTACEITKLTKVDEQWALQTKNGYRVDADAVVLCTGSMRNKDIQQNLKDLGHRLVEPLPSLFTFKIKDNRLEGFAGTSWTKACVRVPEFSLEQTGPLLITHWGFSGPAALKMSAWGARELAKVNYHFTLTVDFLPHLSEEQLHEQFNACRTTNPKKFVRNVCPISFSQKVWHGWSTQVLNDQDTPWGQLPKAAQQTLISWLKNAQFTVTGKSTNKEEFVTCGGVDLSDVHFKTMESKKASGLFFAGEVLNIDGVTGGFNFQSAWTAGYLVGKSLCGK